MGYLASSACPSGSEIPGACSRDDEQAGRSGGGQVAIERFQRAHAAFRQLHGGAGAGRNLPPAFRNPALFRPVADGNADKSGIDMWDRFEVERYLDHHGDKLIRRFDTNSYLIIGKAMDLHDIARGRGTLDNAMSRIKAPTLVLGISSDILYPTYQQKQIHSMLTEKGVDSTYVEIDSPHGHDAFLINFDQVGAPIRAFLERMF